jgi:hypothetical protein
MGVDQLVALAVPQTHLPSGLIYVSILTAAIVCAALILTAPLAWWHRVVFVLGVWCLIVLEVLLLGVILVMTRGLEGTQ